MSLIAPVLDNRRFQEIVDEVRKRIPLYCPEWTDHNVSDPGITLVELFAWMVELLLYRLNQVPELHYIKFMEMLGLDLKPPSAAHTQVTFWLSRALTPENDPDNQGLRIERNVEVSTTQTEVAPPIIFTTAEARTIAAPYLQAVALERRLNNQVAYPELLTPLELADLRSGDQGRNMFSDKPEDDEAVWFGFTNLKHDLSQHIIQFKFNFDDKAGIGINPQQPPYTWDVYTASGGWVELERWRIEDNTRGMNANGVVTLHLADLGVQQVAGSAELNWVRVRIKPSAASADQPEARRYNETPHLLQIVQFAAVGAALHAHHARVIEKEVLGESDGSPGQRWPLAARPVLLPLHLHERLRVKEDVEAADHDGELWELVRNFSLSGPRDRHYVLDAVSGEIRLGPAVRQPSGEIKLYGKVPRRGARLIFESYRYGGGAKGNLARKALNVLKTSIPYVDRVENLREARDGLDGQSLEAAKLAAQRILRTRHLAVTPDDYETRVLEQFATQVARVKCLPVTEDLKERVRVLLIPRLFAINGDRRDSTFTRIELRPPDGLPQQVEEYLNHGRMLTMQVVVENPVYRQIRVQATVKIKANVDQAAVRRMAQQRLSSYLHPFSGGPQGNGWPFGVDLTADHLKQHLVKTPGIQSIENLELFEVFDDGQAPIAHQGTVKLADNEMLLSATHEIIIVARQTP